MLSNASLSTSPRKNRRSLCFVFTRYIIEPQKFTRQLFMCRFYYICKLVYLQFVCLYWITGVILLGRYTWFGSKKSQFITFLTIVFVGEVENDALLNIYSHFAVLTQEEEEQF